MKIEGSTAFVTGANRGLGLRFAEQLIARGATVYAGARNPDSVDLEGAIPIRIDVTDPASVEAAAKAAQNVSILINNAGSSTGSSLLTGPMDEIELEMRTHYFGTLAVTRAFAPQLAAAGESAVLNVLSLLSWYTRPRFSSYAAAKSAEWSLTNDLRLELAAQGTHVAGLHVGFIDTDMTSGLDVPKNDPDVIAARALDGLEAGEAEIVADAETARIQAGLAGGVAALYPQFT